MVDHRSCPTAARSPSCTASPARTGCGRRWLPRFDPVGKNGLPIPQAAQSLVGMVTLSLDGTNVTIYTGSDRTNFTQTAIVLRWTRTDGT